MFSHVMVGSNDIDRAQRFYDAVLGTLGVRPGMRDTAGTGHVRVFYVHDGGSFAVSQPLDGAPATHANGGTIGFRCRSPEQVKAFHDAGVENGGTSIEDPPGERQTTMGAMHLAYVRDPDGNKLCAVCR